MSRENEESRDEKSLTLHDVASAGLSKALRARRRPGSNQLGAWALQTDSNVAPRCGVAAIVRDDSTGDIPEPSKASAPTADDVLASGAVADENQGEWMAEEAGQGDELEDEEFDWEDGEGFADDLAQVFNSNMRRRDVAFLRAFAHCILFANPSRVSDIV